MAGFATECQRGGDIYEFQALVMGRDTDWKEDAVVAATVMDTVSQIYDVQPEFPQS